MKRDNTIEAFFALVRGGLWEQDVLLQPYGEIDFNEIIRLAEEQAIVGLVTAGFEHVSDIKVPKDVALQFVGQALQLEQQNKAMNSFIATLVEKMRAADIYSLLLKGQGIAQCYERPLWRSCGDVDLFLSEDNYLKAKQFLIPLASSVEKEGEYALHLGMTIDPWVIELHGSLRCGLSKRIDKNLDDIKNDIFFGGNVRSWVNGNSQVFMPGIVVDLVYVFTHILNHFYKGGIGMRQLCDWSRLLWTYRETLDKVQLQSRIRKMGLMIEWKAFGAFIVEYLGMPAEVVPLYSPDKRWKRKADRICSFIMEVGNFGHNRDNKYYGKPFIIRKIISFGRRCGDLVRHATIFPLDSIRYFPRIVFNGLRSAANGE